VASPSRRAAARWARHVFSRLWGHRNGSAGLDVDGNNGDFAELSRWTLSRRKIEDVVRAGGLNASAPRRYAMASVAREACQDARGLVFQQRREVVEIDGAGWERTGEMRMQRGRILGSGSVAVVCIEEVGIGRLWVAGSATPRPEQSPTHVPIR
jgi:hypothetical protein